MLRSNQECGLTCGPITKWNCHDDAWCDVMYANKIEQKVEKLKVNFRVSQLGKIFLSLPLFINSTQNHYYKNP